jgi:HEAT repeat protein
MIRGAQRWSILLFGLSLLGFHAALAAELSPADLSAAFSAAAKVEPGGDRSAFRSIEQQARAALESPALRPALEDGLLNLLKGESTAEAKAFACKHLAFIGTAKVVPALAALLDNDEVSVPATSALAQMRSPKADDALREALSRLKGRNRLQVINALGDRRDNKSAGAISKLIQSGDADTATAAIAALGKIGTSSAYEALVRESRAASDELKPAFDQALLACARSLGESSDTKRAQAIYTSFLDSAKAPAVRRAAFTGLLAVQGDAAKQTAIETLRKRDPLLTPVAIEAVRRMPGRDVSKAFIQELPRLAVRDQADLLDSIADRSDAEARAFVANTLSASEPALRMAAIRAVARTGSASDVPVLSKALETNRGSEEQRALESALTGLQGGAATDAAIQTSLKDAHPEARPSLLKALGARKGPDANSLLLEYGNARDSQTALAALRVLEKTAGTNEAATLLNIVRTANEPNVRATAVTAAAHALSQAEDINVRYSLLKAGLSAARSNSQEQAALISLLPVCATPEALAQAQTFLKSENAEVREAAAEAVIDWPSIDAWDALMELNKSAVVADRNAAFRALVRLTGESNAKPDPQLMARYEQLFARASTPADHKLIFGALGGAAHPRALELAVDKLNTPGVRAEAEVAVRKIAGAIKASHPEAATAALQKIPGK